jgi:hypothetical protein
MSDEFLKFMVMKNMGNTTHPQRDNTQLIIFCLMLIFIYLYEKNYKKTVDQPQQKIDTFKNNDVLPPYISSNNMRFLAY